MSSGGLTVQLFLILACTLVTLTDCARPLPDDEPSTSMRLRLLETSQQLSSHTSELPNLSPAHRHEKKSYLPRRPPPPIQDYKLTSDSINKGTEGSSKTISRDRNAELERWQHTYRTMLHKNPAGPNPIGNEYGPENTIHSVKKYRCPPPQGNR